MRTLWRVLLVSFLFATSWASPQQAHAGNTDGILLGDDASLMGGAVTAIVSDGSALWYNPAGLRHVSRNTVDISVTAYSLRLYRIPDAITGGGMSANADVNEVTVIPSALSYVRTTDGGLRIGFGLFTTALSDYSQVSELQFTDPPTGLGWEWLVALENRVAVYHGLLGVAWSANKKLHFGVTGDISYVGATQSSQLGGGLIADQTTGEALFAGTESMRNSLTGVGLGLGVGLMWEPTPAFSLGAAFQTASYLVFQSFQQQAVASAGIAPPDVPGTIIIETSNVDESSGEFDQFEPYRLRFGIAYHFRKGTLSLDSDMQVAERIDSSKWDTTFNGRIGLLLNLSDAVSLGLGAFTDRAPLREQPTDFGESLVDFYGFTTGVKLRKTKKFAETENSDSIAFETTVAFRFAVGTGDFSGFAVIDNSNESELLTPITTDITIYEMSIYIGGGLRF